MPLGVKWQRFLALVEHLCLALKPKLTAQVQVLQTPQILTLTLFTGKREKQKAAVCVSII